MSITSPQSTPVKKALRIVMFLVSDYINTMKQESRKCSLLRRWDHQGFYIFISKQWKNYLTVIKFVVKNPVFRFSINWNMLSTLTLSLSITDALLSNMYPVIFTVASVFVVSYFTSKILQFFVGKMTQSTQLILQAPKNNVSAWQRPCWLKCFWKLIKFTIATIVMCWFYP